MEELRTSLWSRLVVFYSVNKRDQLNPEVMAEIVAKYGSKEKELSARLRKKYGRPLPPSVPAQDLRRVLLEFGMEDQESAGGAAPASASASAEAPSAAPTAGAVDGRTADEGGGRDPTGSGRRERGQEGQGQGQRQRQRQRPGESQAERPPRGSELDFRSRFFDPLQALNHETLRPPFPRERALDNLAKFARIMPKRAAAAAAAAAAGMATAEEAAAEAQANPLPPAPLAPKKPAAVAGGTTTTTAAATGGASHGTPRPGVAGKPARDPAVARGRSSPAAPESVAAQKGGPISDNRPAGRAEGGTAVAAGGGGASRRGVPGESGVGGSIGGHYGPPVGSAEELARIDKVKAQKRRNTEVPLAGGVAGPAVPDEERLDPVQRIMREYAGKGPYSLLYRLHEDKRRASVMIRRVNSIRGTCTGLIRAFDRHMNLLLVDVREDYTALVPDREPPKPGSKRQEQRRRRPQEGAPSPDPLQGAGGGGMGVELGSGDSRGNQPADVGGAGSARGLSTGVGGEGEEGGWGGSVSWGGGGSVSWGGGGSGAEEVEGVCHPHGMTPARDAQRKGAPSAEEVAAGDSGGGGDGGGSHTFGGGGGGSGGGGGGDVGRGRGAVAPAAAGSSGAAAELVNTESVVGVRNEAVPSSHPRETPCSTETTRGLGSEQQPTTGVFLAEKEEANDGGPGAGRDSRIGGVQPPPGGAERADRTGVGGQGQRGGFGQPPVEGGGPGGQEGGGGSGTTEVMKKKSTRKSRGRGPWRGELVPVRRRRFLKQLMIRGDNVVMIWEESPKR